jgi:pilus assembly protein Flp/PilA
MHINAGDIAMLKLVRKLLTREEGLTTVEYAIAGTLVTLAVVGAFTALGTAVSGQIMAIVAKL